MWPTACPGVSRRKKEPSPKKSTARKAPKKDDLSLVKSISRTFRPLIIAYSQYGYAVGIFE